MKPLHYSAILASLLLAGGVLAILQAEEPAPQATPRAKPTVPFMRQKLLYSQGLIEGLVTENYQMIMQNSRRLSDLTVSNVWITIQHPDYIRHLRHYQDRSQDLMKASRQADLKKATRAFNRLMETCVECHRDYRLKQLHRHLDGR